MHTTSDYTLASLDHILALLYPPDFVFRKQRLDESDSHYFSDAVKAKERHSQEQLAVFISRIWNYRFGDHCWHDEASARAFLIGHVTYLQEQKKLYLNYEQIDKIHQIYRRLASISCYKGYNWVEDLSLDAIGSYYRLGDAKAIAKRLALMLNASTIVITEQGSVVPSIKMPSNDNSPNRIELVVEIILKSISALCSVALEACFQTTFLTTCTQEEKALLRIEIEKLALSLYEDRLCLETAISRDKFVGWADDFKSEKLFIDAENKKKINRVLALLDQASNALKRALIPLVDRRFQFILEHSLSEQFIDLLPQLLDTTRELYELEENGNETEGWDYSNLSILLEWLGISKSILFSEWNRGAREKGWITSSLLFESPLYVNHVGNLTAYFKHIGALSLPRFQHYFKTMRGNLEFVRLLRSQDSKLNGEEPFIDAKRLTQIAKGNKIYSLVIEQAQLRINGNIEGFTPACFPLLKKFTHLTYLSLQLTEITDEYLITIGKISQLHGLYLEGSFTLKEGAWGNLLSLRKLKKLVLCSSWMADYDLGGKIGGHSASEIESAIRSSELLELTTSLTTLKKLELEGEINISSQLPSYTHLRKLCLYLSHCEASFGNFSSFTQLKKFQCLDISRSQLAKVCELTQLRELGLPFSRPNEEVFSFLKEKTTPGFIWIQIYSKVDDDSFFDLSKIPKLKYLAISDASLLTRDSAYSLELGFPSLKSLTCEKTSSEFREFVEFFDFLDLDLLP